MVDKVCGAVEKDFSFFVPMEIVKAASGDMRIGGLATSEEGKDIQGEKVLVAGLDTSYLQENGHWNWNHGKGPGDLLGEIDVVQKDVGKGTLYVEGFLYPAVDQAIHVYKLMKGIKESGSSKKLGLSIEGKIKERDSATGKLIKKAWIKNVAITANPINTGTYVDFVKSLGDFTMSPCDGDCTKCSLCDCPTVKKADDGIPGKEPTIDVDVVTTPEHRDNMVRASEGDTACPKCGKPMVAGHCAICEPLPPETRPVTLSEPEPAIKALSAGHDIAATTGGISGSALRADSEELKPKVTTWTEEFLSKLAKKKDMTKAELAGWLFTKGYNVKESAALAHLIFMSTDENFEKAGKMGMKWRQHMTRIDVPLQHQIRIAKDTLKMSDAGAMIMGGMTKEEARNLLKQHGIPFHEEVEKGIVNFEKAGKMGMKWHQHKGITFKHKGSIRGFKRGGSNLPNGDIPGVLGHVPGVLKVTGEGFKFVPNAKIEKGIVQAFQRVVRGKSQHVKSFHRLDKEGREHKKLLKEAVEKWTREDPKMPFAAWLSLSDKPTFQKLTEGFPGTEREKELSAAGTKMRPYQRNRVLEDFADIMGLPKRPEPTVNKPLYSTVVHITQGETKNMTIGKTTDTGQYWVSLKGEPGKPGKPEYFLANSRKEIDDWLGARGYKKLHNITNAPEEVDPKDLPIKGKK